MPTTPTDADPRAFLETVASPRRRADSLAVLELMADVTGAPAVM